MTQENAADRAPGFEETTAAASDSFAQGWLDAEKTEIVEETDVASRSRVVATLPDWTTFSKAPVEPRKGWDWREILRGGKARTSGVALVAFGLGVFCASGGWLGGEKERVESPTVATTVENSSENEALLQNIGDGGTNDALTTIDSSTLRSVPGVDALAQPIGNAEIAAILEDGAGSAGFNGSAVSASPAGSVNSVNSTVYADSTSVGVENAVGAAANVDSSWRRGVDFERGLEASTTASATAERYPTWEELETGGFAGAPNVASVANVPNAATTPNLPVAPNAAIVPNTASAPNLAGLPNLPVAPNAAVAANGGYPTESAQTAQYPAFVANAETGGNADYAGFSDGAGYQAAAAANLPPVAPELTGISQNSGYNQVDGSENFAGFATVPNAVAPTSSRFAAAPNAVAPTSSGFAAVPNATAPSSSGFAAAPNATAPRAFVAQAPGETSVPVVPSTPNLRW